LTFSTGRRPALSVAGGHRSKGSGRMCSRGCWGRCAGRRVRGRPF